MKKEGTIDSVLIKVGPTSSDLVVPDQVWSEIRNMQPTRDGGYISAVEPMALVPHSLTEGDVSPTVPRYGATYGVFHARVRDGARDVLLAQVDDQIWEFEGWRRRWRCLIGPSGVSGGVDTESALPEPATTDFPPQFVATPTGVVIIPVAGRAYFYDGEVCAPLGYDHAPAPPTGMGPESTSQTWFSDASQPRTGVNDTGYAMDALSFHPSTSLHPVFRMGRLGTIDTPGNISTLAEPGGKTSDAQVMGYLKPGKWRSKCQWVDRWGNLSPLSPSSNDVMFRRQPSMSPRGTAAPFTLRWEHPDAVRKQVAWAGVRKGPDGTIGRVLYRTKDLENSGDPRYFELPRDASVTAGAFATMPDNMSEIYPDNIPDAWLIAEPPDIIPFPDARLVEMAFGRCFFANAPGDEGALWYSMLGKWGTIEIKAKLYPDPAGAAITGIKRVAGGLLATTARGVYLVTPNDSGDGFRSQTIHDGGGCVAPSSLATARDGSVYWLGQDGFYKFDGESVSFQWENHRFWSDRLNRARFAKAVAAFDPASGEYRCWVSYENSAKNNVCFVFDGQNWRMLDYAKVSGICVTDDHRRLCIVSGDLNGNEGVWVCDRGGDKVRGTLKTGWIRGFDRSSEAASVRTLHLWFRETHTKSTVGAKIRVTTRTDWRYETVDDVRVQAYPEMAPQGTGKNPDTLGAAKYGFATWRRRRPFWSHVSLSITAAEVFQLEITSDDRFEIMGYSFEEQPRQTGGAMQARR